MEEKGSDWAKVDGDALARRLCAALDSVASDTAAGHRIMRLAKYGVAYALALVSKVQADMLEEIAVQAARAAGKKERAVQNDLMQAAHAVVRPGTGMDARPPPEERK